MRIKNRRSFIIGLKSTKLNKSEVTFLKKYKPWGVILFQRNINSINQVCNLTTNIKKIFKRSSCIYDVSNCSSIIWGEMEDI